MTHACLICYENYNILSNSDFNVPVSNEEETALIYKYSIVPTLMRMNNHYYTIYCIWLNFIFNGMGPFIVLITLNTLMLIKLKKMTSENEQVIEGL